MQKVCSSQEFEWIDCSAPGETELEALATEYQLPSNLIQDCLDARHLPKFESFADLEFLIIRVFDPQASVDADSIQELTRKVAIIMSSKRLITVHRTDFEFMRRLRDHWASAKIGPESMNAIVIQLFLQAAQSYRAPIDESLDQLESLEMGLFEARGGQQYSHEKAYILKRRSFVFQRMIKAISALLPTLRVSSKLLKSEVKSVDDLAEKLLFDSDQLGESITSLMNLSLSMASNRTNDVMRVLTIFSMFLLPLNVVTGIYGMNFESMPELKNPLGYPMALGLMLLLEIVIFVWFRKRGWLVGVR